MLIGDSLPFVREYIAAVNEAIKSQNPHQSLSRIQCYWLSFVIIGLLVTNSVCWSRFERFGMERYSSAGLSWMFRRAKILWEKLLQGSVLHLVENYKIRSGVLAIDDSDIARSRGTSQISKVHKIRDKSTGGYLKGQNIVFLLLVNERVTLPVGFEFYEPDPKKQAWKQEDKRLRKAKVSFKHRPKAPEVDSNYPSKKMLGISLLKQFKEFCPKVVVKAVVADAAYGTASFMEAASESVQCQQVISQIRSDQLIIVNGKEIAVETFFKEYQGHTTTLNLRGQEREVTYCGGRFKVKSHGKKYAIIALKYGDEEEYRYLIGRDMSWLDTDIIKAYALRWLVEVFIQDWKSYEGWNQLAKQPGNEGSERGVILSLLSDHVLLLHPEQKALIGTEATCGYGGVITRKGNTGVCVGLYCGNSEE